MVKLSEMKISLENQAELIGRGSLFSWKVEKGCIQNRADLYNALRLFYDTAAAHGIRLILNKHNLPELELLARFNYAFERQGIGKHITMNIEVDEDSLTLNYSSTPLTLSDIQKWSVSDRIPYWHYSTLRAAVNKKFTALFEYEV